MLFWPRATAPSACHAGISIFCMPCVGRTSTAAFETPARRLLHHRYLPFYLPRVAPGCAFCYVHLPVRERTFTRDAYGGGRTTALQPAFSLPTLSPCLTTETPAFFWATKRLTLRRYTLPPTLPNTLPFCTGTDALTCLQAGTGRSTGRHSPTTLVIYAGIRAYRCRSRWTRYAQQLPPRFVL